MSFYVYLLASRTRGTLYCGMTDDLARRVWEHKEKVHSGFTAKYDVTRLVWYETYDDRENAFIRERRIKEWKRSWKVEMIESGNPDWTDQYDGLT